MNDSLTTAKLIAVFVAVFIAGFVFALGVGFMFVRSEDNRMLAGALFVAIGTAMAVPTALVLRRNHWW